MTVLEAVCAKRVVILAFLIEMAWLGVNTDVKL